jgi:limonene-1,2-epoxide hydrolase
MTDQISTEASTDNALVVEKFLYALQDQDFDTSGCRRCAAVPASRR